MSTEARGIWMLSRGFISSCYSVQGTEDEEEKCQCLLHQPSGDGQRAISSGSAGQCSRLMANGKVCLHPRNAWHKAGLQLSPPRASVCAEAKQEPCWYSQKVSMMRRGLAAEDPGGRTNVSVESCLLLPLCSSVQAAYRDSEFAQRPPSFRSWLPGKDNFPGVL